MAKPKRNPYSEELANKVIKDYQPESEKDMQHALKDILVQCLSRC
ncbi:transposase of IS256Bsu1 [Gracilibacillus halophilus YIM-C55.5]|uniref:Transposase of IS256Bsu1 n=1 Tax=Gracilibacillus halophilus YIM-C55.5 TaxID=1308866 RepID=N4WME3_9BACI|nr:transposase of IS256Bsu1 [Gracilibacillus halophilus YIM-C55.5]